jgi:hypothetical protein
LTEHFSPRPPTLSPDITLLSLELHSEHALRKSKIPDFRRVDYASQLPVHRTPRCPVLVMPKTVHSVRRMELGGTSSIIHFQRLTMLAVELAPANNVNDQKQCVAPPFPCELGNQESSPQIGNPPEMRGRPRTFRVPSGQEREHAKQFLLGEASKAPADPPRRTGNVGRHLFWEGARIRRLVLGSTLWR